MNGKDIEVKLLLGTRSRSPLERTMIIDAFVNALGLALGGYKGKDTIKTDSISEPAIIRARVAAHHDNSVIVAHVMRIATNCHIELNGPVAITPVVDLEPPQLGYFG